VTWAPDEGLTRDELKIRGEIDDEQIQLLAAAVLPNADELFNVDEWPSGSRGIAQIVIAHTISVRLRSSHTAEAELP